MNKLNILNNKIISLLLLFFILISFSFSPFLTSVYSQEIIIEDDESSENDNNNSWLKGVIFLGTSVLLGYLLEAPSEDLNNKRINEKPLIKEKEISTSERKVLGFYVNWLTEYADSFQSLNKNNQFIDMIAPFWYTLDPDGKIRSRYGGHQPEAVQLARQKDIDIFPLINNNQRNNNILTDPEIRKKAVNSVVNLINDYEYNGVNIDFENIPPDTREGYVKFIQLLSRKLAPYDRKLTVSVFPKINVPDELHKAHDYRAIAPYIDKLVMMTYDHHWPQGPPGPIAPINWVEKNIKYALQHIPAEKLFLGIANYGYNWIAEGNTSDLGAQKVYTIAERENIEIKRDKDSLSPYLKYQDHEGNLREIWFEDSYSLEPKLDLVNKYNLKGIGIWRLGNEKNRFWKVIAEKLNK